jgi:hypothetical protein
MRPGLQEPVIPCSPTTTGDRVEGRRSVSQGWIRLAEELHQVAIQVGSPGRDQIDDRDADAILEQGGAPGDEGATVLGPVRSLLAGLTISTAATSRRPDLMS